MCHCYKNEFFNLVGNSSFSHRIHMRCKCQTKHFFMCFSAKSIDLDQNLFPGESLSRKINVNAKMQRLKKFVIFVFLLDIF